METEYHKENDVITYNKNGCSGDYHKKLESIAESELHIDVCAKIISTARVSKIKEKVSKFILSKVVFSQWETSQ